MSRPSINPGMRGQKAISPMWLSERVTLRHHELQASTEVGGSERVVMWEGDVWAMYQKYDQWVGVLGANEGFEGLPIEVFFVVRFSQDSPVVVRDLEVGDEIDWQDKTFTISFVDASVWTDGVSLYCKTKE